MSPTMRRTGIVVAAVLLLAGGAGLPAARAARAHAGPLVVEYWENLCWEPAKTNLQTMVTAFNTSHPGIHLKPVCFSNANVLQPKLLLAIQQHRPPALSQTDAFAVATYADQGTVQDLTPYIQGPNGLRVCESNSTSGRPPFAEGALGCDSGLNVPKSRRKRPF